MIQSYHQSSDSSSPDTWYEQEFDSFPNCSSFGSVTSQDIADMVMLEQKLAECDPGSDQELEMQALQPQKASAILMQAECGQGSNRRIKMPGWQPSKASSILNQREYEPKIEEVDEEDWINIGYSQVQAATLNRTDNLDLNFNDAVNDLRFRINPHAPFIYADQAARNYNRRIYRTRYDVPIQNQTLTIADGEQLATIKGMNVRAILDASAHYNLITEETTRRLKIIPHEVISPRTHMSGRTTSYCAYVPVVLGNGPILPGLFIIVDNIQGGYELLMGKPWLIGIEKFNGNYKTQDAINRIQDEEQHYQRFVNQEPYPYASDTSNNHYQASNEDVVMEDGTLANPRSSPTRKRLKKWGSHHRSNLSTRATLGGSFLKAL
jgi:hypothetical protein